MEINGLLQFVATSGCAFYRNGSWYDSKRAQAHLREKYDWLAAHDLIRTAEDFIEKGATRSMLSSRPYQVSCRGAAPMASGQWLRDELARYRTHLAEWQDCAPRCTRGAPGIGSSGSNQQVNRPF
ncbi:MAG: DUF5329 domain-containing protein [Steroidobacteraceae bacterium]